MADPQELYRPWQINGTYFNRMLQCGPRASYWLEHALKDCLPIDILDAWKAKLAFLSTTNSDAFRIAKATRENRELIFISERIIPPKRASEDHPDIRYFVFVALHEVVHAIKQHKPPNEISEAENSAQEIEADTLAFDWYNTYLKSKKNPHLPEFTKQDLDKSTEKNLEIMKAAL